MPSAPLDVVAAVVSNGGRILACRRSPGRSAAGRWEFPGGKVEPGEAPEAALVREIREELGIEIAVAGRVSTADTTVDGRVIRLTCFRAVLVGPRPTSSTDHDLLLWCRPSELPALDWAEPDLPAVRLLAAEPDHPHAR